MEAHGQENERSLSMSMDDFEHSWLKESDSTWLENWWKSVGTGNLTVKSRLSSKKRVFADAKRSSSVKSVDIGVIDMFQFVQEEQCATNYYEVILNGPQGLGLNLNVSMAGRVTVQSLSRMSSGQPSPAMLSGCIQKGDVLIGINGNDLEKMELVEITALMKLVEKTGKVNLFYVDVFLNLTVVL